MTKEKQDNLFPIQNWQETWPFFDDFLHPLFFHTKTIPITSVTELICLKCFNCNDPEIDDLNEHEINEIFRRNICGNYFIKNNKLYFKSYETPLQAEKDDVKQLEIFRIDYLNFDEILFIGIKSYIKTQPLDSFSLWYHIFPHLCNENISCKLTNFLKTLPLENKKIVVSAFLENFKRQEEYKKLLNGIDLQCLENILYLLNIEKDLLKKLLENYKSYNSF